MQTYEMVDKHIRRLDADLARFESELKRNILLSKQDEVGSVVASHHHDGIANAVGGGDKKLKKSDMDKELKKKRKDEEMSPKSFKKKKKVIFLFLNCHWRLVCLIEGDYIIDFGRQLIICCFLNLSG